MKWNDETIKDELLKSINILCIDRMPTASELLSIGRNDLHCKISRTKKYGGWAKELGLSLKSCETREGQKYEGLVSDILSDRGYDCELTSTRHPYDILVNHTLKIDVKASKQNTYWGPIAYSFGNIKEHQTCDILILLGLNDDGSVEKIFIIPSHLMKLKSNLNICGDSKYNEFIGRWDIIQRYVDFYKGITWDLPICN